MVGSSDYLEDKKDTTHSFYVATHEITNLQQPFEALLTLNRIKMLIKELGANTFFIDTCIIKDSSLSVRIKSYFTFTKAFDENKDKRIKNRVIAFSLIRKRDEFQSLYIDDSLCCFPSLQFLELNFKPNQTQKIKVCNENGISVSGARSNKTPQGSDMIQSALIGTLFGATGTLFAVGLKFDGPVKIHYNPNKEAKFIILLRYPLIPLADLKKEQKNKYFNCGSKKLSYDEGRFLMELYKYW